MSSACESFRVELERAVRGGGRALARLAAEPHARQCGACRTALAREQMLERALAAVPAPAVPPALARRVLAALAHERLRAPVLEEHELDELLESVPAPPVPPDLGARVLAGLVPERSARRRRPRWAWLVAAGLLVGAGLWAVRARSSAPPPSPLVEAEDLESDEELLAYACERWEELHDEDLDVWLASIDPLDELLLEYAEESWPENAAPADAAGGF
ncbi:MAG: hypothetical protein EXS08_05215 [Planctomycetes bacterium]|nr:hypothetical protein [Planctomycetota bacterium]